MDCYVEPETVEPQGVEHEPEVSDSSNASATAAAAAGPPPTPAKRKRKPPTCKVCGQERTAKNGHTSFRGTPYCQLGEGPGAKTPLQWRREQRAAVAVNAASVEGMPHRVTLCRWRSRMRQDKRVLQEERGKPQSQPGDPCIICRKERTLDTGHAYFKGQFFCELEGPGLPSPREWLAAQRGPGDAGKIPRTTAWNIKKRMGRQPHESSSSSSPGPSRRRKHRPQKLCVSSSSSSPVPESPSPVSSSASSPEPSQVKPQKRRWLTFPSSSSSPSPPASPSPSPGPAPPASPSPGPSRRKHKPHKLRTCQKCLQPAQKDYGHSRFEGQNFCALYAGKSVELWLAEKMDLKTQRPL